MKKGDFITINYTGRAEELIFDTTDTAVAKEAKINRPVTPVTICLGERHVLPGLDEALIGKDKGKHTITLTTEHAFGKKSTKKMELIPLKQLTQQKITPQPGMELEIDDKYGIVRSVSGGRVIVDFNHPLAGKDVTYDVDIIGQVTDTVAQIRALLDVPHLPYDTVNVTGGTVTITVPQIYPQELMDAIQKKITTLTSAKNVTFEQGKKN